MKDTFIMIKIDSKTKEEFQKCCKENEESMSQKIMGFIKRTVKAKKIA